MKVRRYPPNDHRNRIGFCEDGRKMLMPTVMVKRNSEYERDRILKRSRVIEEAVVAWIELHPATRKAFMKKFKSLAEFNPADEKKWKVVHGIMAIAHLVEPIDVGQFEGLDEHYGEEDQSPVEG